MLSKSPLKISCGFCAGSLLTATVVSFCSQSAWAAHHKATPPIVHGVQHAYATHWTRFGQPATLPYGPEYGFLTHVPPNAIRTPGYTFVPGVGILGESCDLPTSACPNEYRDVQ